VNGEHEFRPWQSFADLAMGLMAVFALTLITLLWRQSTELEHVRDDARQLKEEQRAFAVALLSLLERTDRIVTGQEDAEAWLRRSFEEQDCLLRVTEDGQLRVVSSDGQPRSAELYDPGETRLNVNGQEALQSCRANFLRLAYALAPEVAPVIGPAAAQEEAEVCRVAREEVRASREVATDTVAHLRTGLEALVLEGNTDRASLSGELDHRRIPPIVRGTVRNLELTQPPTDFVENALLGAERARQALGHLLDLVQACDHGERDALEVLMSRVRVESPAFGRYLAGPLQWRSKGCGEDDACDAARNLSLRVRWRKEELRKPYFEFRGQFCALLGDPESSLVKGLLADGRDVRALAAEHCGRGEQR